MAVELGGINYSEPNNSKPRLLIRKLAISRSRIQSTSKIKFHSIEKLAMEKESILMENNKPLVINR